MRRRAGVGAIHKQKLEAERYKDKGTEIQENQFEQMTKQMEFLKTNLEEFADKHKNEIRKNATFRRQFTEMCAAIGVDPLASGKGVWSVLGMGDFYFELSIQIVEICLALGESTGGMLEISELKERLSRSRRQKSKQQEITIEDILLASKKLKIFGNSFQVHPLGKNRFIIQSIPGELSLQETKALTVAANQETGSITKSLLMKELGWNELRTQQATEKLISEGLVWIDEQNEYEPSYWFPSLFPDRKNVE
ncbi:CLUMA_CG021339, isoform A [Clunio marinus]|uniref:Vacuolar-sorting protein SNF8 n=1 Tax=Clunio marinus TaxID=568069 RepID=A0A1J1JAM2_9DIPT|nr:CLUMA_CG021339, isoform A [Clunio marinus]